MRVAAGDGIKSRLDVAVMAAVIYGIAAILGLIAFLYALEAGRVALLMWWPAWAAALIVAGGLLVTALLVILIGRLVLRQKRRRAALLSAGTAPMLAMAPSALGLVGGILAKHPRKILMMTLLTGAIAEFTRSRK